MKPLGTLGLEMEATEHGINAVHSHAVQRGTEAHWSVCDVKLALVGASDDTARLICHSTDFAIDCTKHQATLESHDSKEARTLKAESTCSRKASVSHINGFC